MDMRKDKCICGFGAKIGRKETIH